MARRPSDKKIIEAFRATGGVLKHAAIKLNCSRTSLYNWIREFPKLAYEREQAEEEILDMAESKLYKAVNDGDMQAIIYILKTKGKKRGYIEKSEVQIDKNAEIEVGYSNED